MNDIIKEGTLFVFTSGSYSDYQMYTACVALRDINVKEEIDLFSKSAIKARTYSLMNWVVNIRKAAKEIQLVDWWMNDYDIERSYISIINEEIEDG